MFAAHGNPKRFQQMITDFLFNLNLEEMLRSTASEKIFVWMKPQNGKIESFELSGENAVYSDLICYNSGASLYFR